MGAGISVTRNEFSAAELRSAASKCDDGVQVRRVPALAMVLEGGSRSEAASSNGMDRQTLSDWVHRYKESIRKCGVPRRRRAIEHKLVR